MGTYFLWFGTAANILGTVPYLWGTLRGDTKPNRVSWLFWGLAPGIAAVASLSAGAGLASVPVFCSSLLCLLIFAASFINPKAYWKLHTLDYLCAGLALLALILWALTQNPSLAIFFAIVSDFFAALPTMLKAWTNPETESPWTYVGGALNALGAFFVLPAFTFAYIAFPLEITFIDSTVLLALIRGYITRKH